MCMHAYRELVCMANISTVLERILLKFYILLRENQRNGKELSESVNTVIWPFDMMSEDPSVSWDEAPLDEDATDKVLHKV